MIVKQKDYELLDSGDFLKLERFGRYVLIRPEPQALWGRSLTKSDWDSKVDAIFVQEKESHNKERGFWEYKRGVKFENWDWSYEHSDSSKKSRSSDSSNCERGGNCEKGVNSYDGAFVIRFDLSLTSFKHVGLFPEQAGNWDYIYDKCRTFHLEKGEGVNSGEVKLLNLFAYTGGASLAGAKAGAKVTHVDSVKPVVSWAKRNAILSGVENDIRYIVDDALKFVKREARRGSRYDMIVLDPPAYGRGPEGEKWLLEESLLEMLEICRELLNRGGYVVLNLYSMGYSPTIAKTLLESVFGIREVESGELSVEDSFGKVLPLGVFARGRVL